MSGRIDKTELIKKLRDLEGLTNEEKSNLIGLLRQHKKYGLVWEDKPEDVEERLREELPVLKEVKERALISDQPDAPNHILIEGDNLEALTALSYTHEGKIDVIYIDPPYNTGNKDFAYYDDFCDEYRTIPYVEREDAFRHSKWLSFMSKRLRIAKRLLSDKGVIFISIDDNEQANLKLLCDEVFGEDKYIGEITWLRKKKGSNLSKEFRKVTEYLTIYKKTGDNIELFGEKAYAEKLVPLLNRPNNISTLSFKGKTVRVGSDVKTLFISKGSYGDGELSVELFDDLIIEDGFICNDFSIKGRFRWTQETVNDELKNGSIFYFSKTLRINVSRYNQGEKFKATSSLLGVDDAVGTNEDATQELRNIFCEKETLPFDFPKPVSLIKYVLNSITAQVKTATVLDFFAGSGTTLHATMQLNAEDGGHRQCILVTNNENGICEKVTYERNKRVIQGYTTPKGQVIEGLHNNNLRYYRTEFIPRERTQRNMRALVNAATDLLCIKEDLYEEKPLLGTLKLKPQLARYFSNGQKHMLVVYREEVVTELVEAIKTLELGKSMLKIYIFSPGRYAFDDNFYEVQDKVQLVALPAAIYDAYQRVLPKQKERLLDEAEEPTPQPTASAMTIDFEEGGEK